MLVSTWEKPSATLLGLRIWMLGRGPLLPLPNLLSTIPKHSIPVWAVDLTNLFGLRLVKLSFRQTLLPREETAMSWPESSLSPFASWDPSLPLLPLNTRGQHPRVLILPACLKNRTLKPVLMEDWLSPLHRPLSPELDRASSIKLIPHLCRIEGSDLKPPTPIAATLLRKQMKGIPPRTANRWADTSTSTFTIGVQIEPPEKPPSTVNSPGLLGLTRPKLKLLFERTQVTLLPRETADRPPYRAERQDVRAPLEFLVPRHVLVTTLVMRPRRRNTDSRSAEVATTKVTTRGSA